MQRMQDCVGYPLDSFQQQALDVIVSGNDLLVTCPTGSGKTIVAITAIILQAFDKGKRVILTTPIKALSNQKYAECNKWLSSVEHPKRITLLTGDIQERCAQKGGDGNPELFIMTSEILANKLDTIRTGGTDMDLDNVSVLVIDETHFINDTDRGHVWERTIMNLPTNIQLVALSATLAEPERFREWLEKRRPTQLVQRTERHVPLYLGGYDGKGQFVELFSTKGKRAFESKTFKSIAIPFGNTNQTITKLVSILKRDDKLPAIVFCLSKKKCVQAAECLDLNLLYGSAPVQGKEDDPDTYAYLKEEHQWKVARIRERQEQLYRHYLGPYRVELESLPGFDTFTALLDKGIGYHHAGMIPILREYVELLFAEKLLQVVFATETLAVGINMPARTTVFTQLEKPTGHDQSAFLQPDQFWQMAGRAGRRGMDDKGFVVYYPLERTPPSESDVRRVMLEGMPPVTSQLQVTPFFVLKHYGEQAFIQTSLLSHQHEKAIGVLQSMLAEMPPVSEDKKQAVARYTELEKKLKGDGFIKLTTAQRKTCEKEMVSLQVRKEEVEQIGKRLQLERDLAFHTHHVEEEWSSAERWLEEHEFIKDGRKTVKGMITSGLTDGEPLLRGTIIANGLLHGATFHDIVGFLGCFTEPIRPATEIALDAPQLFSIMDEIEDLHIKSGSFYSDKSNIQYDTGMLMYLWSKHKNIKEIGSYVDMSQLGVFIKAVLRVISFIDELKTILLGMHYYELYNVLENHQEKLLEGIVTNRSLYVM